MCLIYYYMFLEVYIHYQWLMSEINYYCLL